MSEKQARENLSQEEEQKLVKLAARGDSQALAGLVARYAPLVLAEAHRNRLPYLTEEAHSVAQLYFLEAVRRYEPERGVPFGAFAKSIVHGGISTFAAAEKRRRERELRPDDYASGEGRGEPSGSVWDAIYEAAGGPFPDAYAQVELRETLRLAMENLSSGEREVLVCVYVQQRTLQETADRLGVALLTVKRWKKRLLEKLREALRGNN